MTVTTPILARFNAGRISRLALARTDLKRTAVSAETMTNWMPRTLGSMMLRPGTEYKAATRNNAKARHAPFIFSATDTAWLELTDSTMRVYVAEAAVTRASVATAITNGTFDADLTGWTDADESGATSAWATGGTMELVGNGSAFAIRRQSVSVATADQSTEHGLRIVVARGPATLRVGSSSGADDLIAETDLGAGTHSLAFTPTGGTVWVELKSRLLRKVWIDSCTIEAAGVMELPTPWLESDLPLVRWDQSADVIFVACDGRQQRKIERRATHSWSVVLYQPEDGPFRTQNLTTTTIAASAITGNATLTASKPLFRSDHVGALFQIVSTGQTVSVSVTAENIFSSPIRVSGVGAGDRTFTIAISGTWVATVVLQRSIDSDAGPWSDVSGESWTANTTTTYNDALDNQIVYYRIGVKTGGFTSGTVAASLTIAAGSITGVVRIVGYTSSTSADAEVLTALGGTTATADWSEGSWSDRRGWPTCVSFYEGRLWWAGRDRIVGSVSDGFESFDAGIEGDSGPIDRTIGSGPVDTINWLLSLPRLAAGGTAAELLVRSSTLDEPLTPTNFNIKADSTQGSAAIAAVKVDTRGAFVQRSGRRVYVLQYDPSTGNYASDDLTKMVPDLAEDSPFVALAVQRQPDTRIHAIREDGTAAVLVFDPVEDVACWLDVETDGAVEDCFVLPGTIEDAVYYSIRRTINGATVRYAERWAREDECRGGATNKQADAFKLVTNSPASATVSGLSHLEGAEVVCWADGADRGTFTVSGGAITLPTAVSSAVVGLGYTAQFKSAKLAYGGQAGTALTQPKRVSKLGLILADAHYQGLRYGPSFDRLDDLPLVEAGAETAADTVWSELDADPFTFDGEWASDPRLCLEAAAPRPVTVLAAVLTVTTNERV